MRKLHGHVGVLADHTRVRYGVARSVRCRKRSRHWHSCGRPGGYRRRGLLFIGQSPVELSEAFNPEQSRKRSFSDTNHRMHDLVFSRANRSCLSPHVGSVSYVERRPTEPVRGSNPLGRTRLTTILRFSDTEFDIESSLSKCKNALRRDRPTPRGLRKRRDDDPPLGFTEKLVQSRKI